MEKSAHHHYRRFFMSFALKHYRRECRVTKKDADSVLTALDFCLRYNTIRNNVMVSNFENMVRI
jgi:hypothetical protein